MSIKSQILAGLAAAVVGLPAQAAILNAGFETGDLTGWTYTDGYVEVLTEADDAIVTPPLGEHFTATEGDYFARLTAGPEADVYAVLSQAFTLSAAARISFDAAVLAFDYVADDGSGGLLYNDDAYVRVFSLSTNEVIFASNVAAVGDLGHTSWARFTSRMLAAGDYVLEAGVRNADDPDPGFSSQLLLDNVGTAVPEPAAWTLMLAGFGGLGAVLRRRRNALAA